MTLEYLGTSAPPRRRRSGAVGLAVLIVVAVAAGFLWWSEGVRRDANRTLSHAVVEAEDLARIGEGRVLSTLAYAFPMIWSDSVPDAVRADLRGLVEESARDAGATLEALADEVGGTRVLPWQTAQLDARERVQDYVVAQEQRFERIAADAGDIGDVLAQTPPSTDTAMASLRAANAEE